MPLIETPPISEIYLRPDIRLRVLRLDLVHPVISGNKWYKLKYQLQKAVHDKFEGILTTGGAYSNHLHATAFACKYFGLKSAALVRGEATENETLQDCLNAGMAIKFVSRQTYRNKEMLSAMSVDLAGKMNYLYVPEGGNNAEGTKGIAELSGHIPSDAQMVICAIGSGTTYLGLKNLPEIANRLYGYEAFRRGMVPQTDRKIWSNCHHFGGFGKYTNELLSFMAFFHEKTEIELDCVYTAKLFFTVLDKIANGEIYAGTNIMVIHSGGLQGNRSLPAGWKSLKGFTRFNAIFEP